MVFWHKCTHISYFKASGAQHALDLVALCAKSCQNSTNKFTDRTTSVDTANYKKNDLSRKRPSQFIQTPCSRESTKSDTLFQEIAGLERTPGTTLEVDSPLLLL